MGLKTQLSKMKNRMPAWFTYGVAVGLVFLHEPLLAQSASLPSDSLLRAIELRGQALAAYDQAVFNSADAAIALQLRLDVVTHNIARRRPDGGWSVAFGRLSEDLTAFMISIEATAPAGSNEFKALAFDPERRDTGYMFWAARAQSLTRADLGRPTVPYNVAVLPAESETWWVYHFPAQAYEGVWPHGGDFRYRVSREGTEILEKRRLHNAILYYTTSEGAQSGMHSAIVADIVEDTDVFLVLARTPRIPEVVLTESFTCRIATDGTVACAIRGDGP